MEHLFTAQRVSALVIILMLASLGLSVWTGFICVTGVQAPGVEMYIDLVILTIIELTKYSALFGARISRTWPRAFLLFVLYLAALTMNGWYLHRYTAHVDAKTSTPAAMSALKNKTARETRAAERAVLQAKLDAAFVKRDYGKTTRDREGGAAEAIRLQTELRLVPAIALTDAEAQLAIQNDAKTTGRTVGDQAIQWLGDNRFAVLLALLDCVVLLIPVPRISADERSTADRSDTMLNVQTDHPRPIATVGPNDRRSTMMTGKECEAWVLQLMPRVGDKATGSYLNWARQAGAGKATMYAAIGRLQAGGNVAVQPGPGGRGTTLTRVSAALRLVS